jgi:hypothetical protein
MMQLVQSRFLFAIVAIVVAVYGFATPAQAHGTHNSAPVAQASHTANTHAHDAGELHADVAEMRGQTQDNGKADTAKCCGLSCMTAVPQHNPQLFIIELHHSAILAPLQPELSGRGPARLDRPPSV